MGWTSGYRSKQEIMQMHEKPWPDGNGGQYSVDNHHYTKSGCWVRLAHRRADGSVAYCIGHVRIERHGRDYTEGGLWDEGYGLGDHDCPIGMLDYIVPDPSFDNPEHEKQSKAWRLLVRRFHEEKLAATVRAKSRRSSLRVGDVLRLPEFYKPNTLTVTEVGRRCFGRGPQGGRYNIPPRILAAAVEIVRCDRA